MVIVLVNIPVRAYGEPKGRKVSTFEPSGELHFEKVARSEKSSATSLAAGIKQLWKDRLSSLIADPDFSPDAVVPNLADTTAGLTSDPVASTFVINRALAEEHYRRFGFGNTTPLLDQLTSEDGEHVGREDYCPPVFSGEAVLDESFVEQAVAQLRAADFDFNGLAAMHARIKDTTPYIGLISDVEKAMGDADSLLPGDWRNDVYDLVTQATEDFADFSLPPSQHDDLYFAAFQGKSRRITRELLSFATLANTLNATDEEANALQDYFISKTLTGQKWVDASNGIWLAGDKLQHHATHSKIGMQALQTLVSLGNFIEISEEIRRSAKQLECKAGDTYEGAKPLQEWQQQDLGHCFSHLDFFDLMNPEMRQPIEKDGSKAIIFEDDTSQSEFYQKVVQDLTPHTVSNEGCFSRPDGFLEAALHADTRLIVIDIENHKDPTAGIMLADQVLASRPRARSLPKTKLVLWTASQEALEKAVAYFKNTNDDGLTRLEQHTRRNPLDMSLPGSGSSGGASLTFVVAIKDPAILGK